MECLTRKKLTKPLDQSPAWAPQETLHNEFRLDTPFSALTHTHLPPPARNHQGAEPEFATVPPSSCLGSARSHQGAATRRYQAPVAPKRHQKRRQVGARSCQEAVATMPPRSHQRGAGSRRRAGCTKEAARRRQGGGRSRQGRGLRDPCEEAWRSSMIMGGSRQPEGLVDEWAKT